MNNGNRLDWDRADEVAIIILIELVCDDDDDDDVGRIDVRISFGLDERDNGSEGVGFAYSLTGVLGAAILVVSLNVIESSCRFEYLESDLIILSLFDDDGGIDEANTIDSDRLAKSCLVFEVLYCFEFNSLSKSFL